VVGSAVVAGIISAVPWLPGSDDLSDPLIVAFFIGYALAMAAAPVFLGQLVQARRDLSRRLVEVEQAREHERVLHAQAVLARERAQLAREMHDVVSHQVSLIAVQAGALQVALGDPQLRQAARTIRELSVSTLDELRTMVTLLRISSGPVTELSPQPTLADLTRLVTSSGIPARLTGGLPTGAGLPAVAGASGLSARLGRPAGTRGDPARDLRVGTDR
jgi:signal transduction histidine kinase